MALDTEVILFLLHFWRIVRFLQKTCKSVWFLNLSSLTTGSVFMALPSWCCMGFFWTSLPLTFVLMSEILFCWEVCILGLKCWYLNYRIVKMVSRDWFCFFLYFLEISGSQKESHCGTAIDKIESVICSTVINWGLTMGRICSESWPALEMNLAQTPML